MLDMLRSNRAAQAAAGAVVLLVLVGMAKLVGSHSTKPLITSRTTLASAAAPAAAKGGKPSSELALAPNETLVVPAEKPTGPLMPHYSAPPPPPPAPRAAAEATTTPAAVVAEGRAALAEQQAERLEINGAPAQSLPAAPMAPVFANALPGAMTIPAPAPPPARAQAYCPRCGEVVSLTAWPHMTEVAVRFQDGSTHTMRGPPDSSWRIGDRVRAEGGRLVRD